MSPCLGGSQFNMKNPLNPEHSPLNQDPTGRNSMGSKFNPTPAKAAWSSIVRETVKTYYEDERNLRMSRDQDFRHFLSVFCENNPACFWQLATNSREISLCKYICKLFAFRLSPDYVHNCQLCGARISDVFSHLACSCQFTHEIREKWFMRRIVWFRRITPLSYITRPSCDICVTRRCRT